MPPWLIITHNSKFPSKFLSNLSNTDSSDFFWGQLFEPYNATGLMQVLCIRFFFFSRSGWLSADFEDRNSISWPGAHSLDFLTAIVALWSAVIPGRWTPPLTRTASRQFECEGSGFHLPWTCISSSSYLWQVPLYQLPEWELLELSSFLESFCERESHQGAKHRWWRMRLLIF